MIWTVELYGFMQPMRQMGGDILSWQDEVRTSPFFVHIVVFYGTKEGMHGAHAEHPPTRVRGSHHSSLEPWRPLPAGVLKLRLQMVFDTSIYVKAQS